MSTTAVNICNICKNPMPLKGISSCVNQLVPSRHVRKLNCGHFTHSGCFQDKVNQTLATNFDHRGLVSCPICPNKIEAVHSMQYVESQIQNVFLPIGAAAILSCVMYGVTGEITAHRSKNSTISDNLLKALIGTVVIIAAGKLINVYCDNSPYKMIEPLIFVYNLRYGTHLQKSDILLGMDHFLTDEEILENYYNTISMISLVLESSDEDKIIKVDIRNPKTFVNDMLDALQDDETEIPPIYESAKKHLFQILIDKKNRGAFLIFLTSLAYKKDLLKVPENRVIKGIVWKIDSENKD